MTNDWEDTHHMAGYGSNRSGSSNNKNNNNSSSSNSRRKDILIGMFLATGIIITSAGIAVMTIEYDLVPALSDASSETFAFLGSVFDAGATSIQSMASRTSLPTTTTTTTTTGAATTATTTGAATSQDTPKCHGSAQCKRAFVTRVIDGDTIKIQGNHNVRFALASAPELGTPGGVKALQHIESICPPGSQIIIDEDDMQTSGSYGRTIAVVHCNGTNLNEELLDSGLGHILTRFCSTSEFADTPWAVRHGC